MPRVTLELDEDTLLRARAEAEREGLTVEAWLEHIVREAVPGARPREDWPAELVALIGTWGDFPSAEEIRSGSADDVPRESP
jgi:hypothetical protein